MGVQVEEAGQNGLSVTDLGNGGAGSARLRSVDSDVEDRPVANQQPGVGPCPGSGPVEESTAEEDHVTFGRLGNDLSDDGRATSSRSAMVEARRQRCTLISLCYADNVGSSHYSIERRRG